MSTNIIFEKSLEVIEIRVVPEIATGDLIHQVVFGEYVKCTTNRDSDAPQEVPVVWLTLCIKKTDTQQYAVGSKWKLTRSDNATLNLVGI